MSDDVDPVGEALANGYVIRKPSSSDVWVYADDEVVVDLEEGR